MSHLYVHLHPDIAMIIDCEHRSRDNMTLFQIEELERERNVLDVTTENAIDEMNRAKRVSVILLFFILP